MRREKHKVSEKVKEIIDFNKDLMESPIFEKNYNEINWFMIESHLKEPYIKLLRLIDQLPNNNYCLYKYKPVVEFDFEELTSLSYRDNKMGNSREYAMDLLHRLTEIGIIRNISHESLLNESLNNNHLYSVSLMKRNESHGTFFIVQKLDQEQLSRIFHEIEIKIDGLRKNIKTKEKSLDKPLQSSESNDVRTKSEFYHTLDYLHGEISNLDKHDAASEKYTDFIKNEMDYTYSLLIFQCKLHKEIDLSIKIGRPAFLWRLDQLKLKFKRMHAFKDISFYLQRIDYLVSLDLIKRINFNQIEPELLQFIDEKEIKKKPDLYIFPDINFSVLSRIAKFKSEDLNKGSKPSFGEESGTESYDYQRQDVLKNVEKDESNSPYNSTGIKEEREEENEDKDDKVSELNVEVAEKHKERIKYNLDKIYSDFFEEIYKSINDYLIKNDLKIFYTKILEQISKINNHFLEYKNKPIFYIDDRTLVQTYNNVFPRWVTNDEASKLFYSLIEIGIFEEVSSHTVALDFKITTQELGKRVRDMYSKNFKDDSNLYVLNRLNENVLKRILNKISEHSESEEIASKSASTERENQEIKVKKPEEIDLKSKNNIMEIDYSVTESALDILIESRVEGNKVIIDKPRFDKLIKAILGEVPDI